MTKLRAIRRLSGRVNLWDLAIVEKFIEKSEWCNGRKQIVQQAYSDWAEWKGFKYQTKRYPTKQTIPWIPTERDIDQLIGGFVNSKYAPLIQLIKETAVRPSEATRLRPMDFDLLRKVVNINDTAKYGTPRQMRVSGKLVAMFQPLFAKKKTDEKIWDTELDRICDTFRKMRDRVSEQLGNTNIKRINLKSIRHWKASQVYHDSKDILYTKEFLGHKSLKNTLVYCHIFPDSEDGYTVRVAKDLGEFTSLLESGFEYVSDFEGKKVLKKRK